MVDGDTIILKNDEKIRYFERSEKQRFPYLGIDAPERGKPYFLKAKEYN